jgi:hypothetical protein
MGFGVAEIAVGGFILLAIVSVICKTITDANRPRTMAPMAYAPAGPMRLIGGIVAVAVLMVVMVVSVGLMFFARATRDRAVESEHRVAFDRAEASIRRPFPVTDEEDPIAELELERRWRLESEARVKELEARIAALEKNQPAETPPAPVSAEGAEERGLHVGEKLDEARAKALGLDDLGLLAANRAIEDEEKRLTEILQRMYLDHVKGDADVYAMTAKELVFGLAMKMTPDIESLENLPAEAREKFKAGKTAVEDVLPKDAFLARLALEMHGARQKTYEELGRTLSREQVEQFRAAALGEGDFSWPGGVNFELGPAPDSVKR